MTAAGFAPLELEGEDDAERYDFQFEWNNQTGTYEMKTLYDRGYEGWIAEDSEGDAAFRDNFQAYSLRQITLLRKQMKPTSDRDSWSVCSFWRWSASSV